MEKSFKMKNFFRYLCIVMMFLLSLSVAGCFDDDDEPGTSGSGSGSSSASYNNKGMKDPEDVKIKVKDGKVVTLDNRSRIISTVPSLWQKNRLH